MATPTTDVMPNLRKLASLSKSLNEESDGLAESLQKLQDDLNAMSFGLEVWLDEPFVTGHWVTLVDASERETGNRQRSIQQIGYGRLGDGWGLLVRAGFETERPDHDDPLNPIYDYEDFGHEQSLLRASREVRLRSVPRLQALVSAIETEVTSAIERIASARKLAE